MAKRVTETAKDQDGDITALCGGFGRTSKSAAITEIEKDSTAYYVEEVAPKVYVKVGIREGRKYLTTVADDTHKNNLGNLDDC